MIAYHWLCLGIAASALAVGCGDSAPAAPDGTLMDGSLTDAVVGTDFAPSFDRVGDVTDGFSVLCGESPCGVGLTCCALTWRCYDPGCHGCCEAPGDGGSHLDAPVAPQDSACVNNNDCAAGGYCAGDSCGASGRCVERPTGCTAVVSPVCGCDGVTRVNACVAASEGARVASRGECAASTDGSVDVPGDAQDAPGRACAMVLCPVGTTCCALPGSPAYGACFDPSCRSCCTPSATPDAGLSPDARPGDCLTNADCESPRAFCAGVGCGLRGVCEPRPVECPGIFDPVCGCDGRTYTNPCEAGSAGLRLASRGACLVSGSDGSVTDASTSVCASLRCAVGSVCCDIPRSPTFGTCYDAMCATCCR